MFESGDAERVAWSAKLLIGTENLLETEDTDLRRAMRRA